MNLTRVPKHKSVLLGLVATVALLLTGCSMDNGTEDLRVAMISGATFTVNHVAKAENVHYEKHGKFTDNILNLKTVIAEIKADEGIELRTSDDGQTLNITGTWAESEGGRNADTVQVKVSGVMNAGDEKPEINVESEIVKSEKESRRSGFTPILIPNSSGGMSYGYGYGFGG